MRAVSGLRSFSVSYDCRLFNEAEMQRVRRMRDGLAQKRTHHLAQALSLAAWAASLGQEGDFLLSRWEPDEKRWFITLRKPLHKNFLHQNPPSHCNMLLVICDDGPGVSRCQASKMNCLFLSGVKSWNLIYSYFSSQGVMTLGLGGTSDSSCPLSWLPLVWLIAFYPQDRGSPVRIRRQAALEGFQFYKP